MMHVLETNLMHMDNRVQAKPHSLNYFFFSFPKIEAY